MSSSDAGDPQNPGMLAVATRAGGGVGLRPIPPGTRSALSVEGPSVNRVHAFGPPSAWGGGEDRHRMLAAEGTE
jgi:hypothetical protein